MSLDIYLIDHHRNISKSTLHFSLEESDYIKIFELANPIQKYPNIEKIKDYYSDKILNSSEVKEFVREVESLLSGKTKEFESLINFLNQIDDLKAYFYAD